MEKQVASFRCDYYQQSETSNSSHNIFLFFGK